MKLPFYFSFTSFRRVNCPESDHITLAIWDCGRRFRKRTLWDKFKDIRITIRRNNKPIIVLKKGNI